MNIPRRNYLIVGELAPQPPLTIKELLEPKAMEGSK